MAGWHLHPPHAAVLIEAASTFLVRGIRSTGGYKNCMKERTPKCLYLGKMELVPFLITAVVNIHGVNHILPHYIQHEDKKIRHMFPQEAASFGKEVIDT